MSGPTLTIDPSPALPDKPIKDPSVGPDIVGAKVAYDGEQKLGGVSFGFGLEARASIAAFNSKDDKDPDGVFGVPRKDASTFDIELPAQIEWIDGKAWLKYRYSAAVKGSVSGTVAPVAFKLDASKEAIFTDFHVHSGDDNTRAAVLSDLAQLRFAANPDDSFRLGDKEALSYQVKGRLFASVTLSWSDVFTASLSTLSQFLKSGTLLALKITPAASVTFHVELDDDFQVVFTKGSGTNVVVALKRADAREVGVSVALGVKAEFADQNAVKAALTNVLQSLVGQPVGVIDNILGKATFGDLTDQERAILNEVIKRLGLEDVAHSLQDLKDKWDALKKKVTDTIDQVAKAKIALGFTYDYLRIHTEEALLIAELDQGTFKGFHNELMLCNFQNLLDWVSKNPNSLKQYLSQDKITRTKSWGFSLGIGPWNVGGKDKLALTSIVQHDIQGNERIAYQGLREYDGKWVGDECKWDVDFKAQLENFTPAGTANACQFKYGLHFKWLWNQTKLGKSELRGLLDYAVIWRIITQDSVSEILATMDANFGKTATLTQELTFDDEAFRALLPLAAAAVDGDLPFIALAKSIPYMEEYEGRRSPANREIIYAPLWKFYFQNESRPINMFPLVAAQDVTEVTQLKHIADGPGLALRERGTSSVMPAYQDFFTFSGQLYYHGQAPNDYSGIKRDWINFAKGLKDLNTGLTPGNCAPHQQIETIFGHLAAFWGQSLYVRAAGVFLVDLAATDKSLLAKANRAFTISIKDGDTYSFGASA